MSATELLQALAAAGVTLFVEGDRLRYRAAPGTYSEDLRHAVAKHRAELLALLRPAWDQAKADPHLALALARCDRASKEDARTDGQRRAVDAYRSAVRRLADRHDLYHTLFTVHPDLERAFARSRNTPSLPASAPSAQVRTVTTAPSHSFTVRRY